MENNNNDNNQLITIKHFISRTIQNKKIPNKFKRLKLNSKNKNINTNHKIAKSNKKTYINKTKNSENKIKTADYNYTEIPKKSNKKEIQQKKLDSINLLEKNTKNIYNWDILLSNSNLGLYYNKKEYKKLESPENCKEQNNIFPKDPIILVDLTENEVNKFFGKNTNYKFFSHFNTSKKNSESQRDTKNYQIDNDDRKKRALTETTNEIKDKDKKIISYNIRPMSLYSERKPQGTFYFSNDFSDYYKQDLKTFSEKMPLLKARINTYNKRLRREIFKERVISSKGEKQLNDIKINVDNEKIKFNKLDLIIAGERKNVEPLLKSIYYQENPHLKKVNEHIKMYFKTMKPYGNNKGNIDYTKNDKWHPSREIKYLREKYNQTKKTGTIDDKSNLKDKNERYNNFNKKSKPKLILSYYKIDDPNIKYFNSLINSYNQKTINNDDDKIKENIYLTTFQNMRNYNYRKELIDKEFSKFPFIIEQYEKYKKEYNKEDNN